MTQLFSQPPVSIWVLLFPVVANSSVTMIAVVKKPLNLLVIETDEHRFGTLVVTAGKLSALRTSIGLPKPVRYVPVFYATTSARSPLRTALVSGLYPQ